MALKVYIAAPYPLKDYAKDFRDLLQHPESGLECTSHWLDGESDDTEAAALMDLDDIDRADVFVLLNPSAWANKGSGGRHFECGYAYATKKPIFILGPRTSVFHHIRSMQFCNSPSEVFYALLKYGA